MKVAEVNAAVRPNLGMCHLHYLMMCFSERETINSSISLIEQPLMNIGINSVYAHVKHSVSDVWQQSMWSLGLWMNWYAEDIEVVSDSNELRRVR